MHSIRKLLARLGEMAALGVLVLYALLWFIFDRATLDWHAVATLSVWFMTLLIFCHSTALEPTHWRTPGKTLWTTPAMAAGVTKRLWEVGDGGRARSVGGGDFIKNLRRRGDSGNRSVR
jgi:hypothetical protein